MNIRISEGQLRFRITREELQRLQNGVQLALSLPVQGQSHTYTVALKEQNMPLNVELKAQEWKLWIDKSALQQFADALPSREGIEHTIMLGDHQLKLVLEVDVRRRSS